MCVQFGSEAALVSDIHTQIGDQIARLRVLWPVLNSREEHLAEIENALARHAHRLHADDVTAGFSTAIENAPTAGWPPGPHEILGCVLKAAETRRAVMAPKVVRHYGGLTFSEWWATVPEGERHQHAALHKLMTGRALDETPADPDEIAWEDAAWEEAA